MKVRSVCFNQQDGDVYMEVGTTVSEARVYLNVVPGDAAYVNTTIGSQLQSTTARVRVSN